MRKIGTTVYGLRAPIVKQGDDLVQIVVDTVLNSGIEIENYLIMLKQLLFLSQFILVIVSL